MLQINSITPYTNTSTVYSSFSLAYLQNIMYIVSAMSILFFKQHFTK